MCIPTATGLGLLGASLIFTYATYSHASLFCRSSGNKLSLSQDPISVIATRTVCLGYSAAANQRQHCDGTGGPFNQQKLKGKGGALSRPAYRSSPSNALIRFIAQRWSTACSTPVPAGIHCSSLTWTQPWCCHVSGGIDSSGIITTSRSRGWSLGKHQQRASHRQSSHSSHQEITKLQAEHPNQAEQPQNYHVFKPTDSRCWH